MWGAHARQLGIQNISRAGRGNVRLCHNLALAWKGKWWQVARNFET